MSLHCLQLVSQSYLRYMLKTKFMFLPSLSLVLLCAHFSLFPVAQTRNFMFPVAQTRNFILNTNLNTYLSTLISVTKKFSFLFSSSLGVPCVCPVLSHFSCIWLCYPTDQSPPGSPIQGFSRQEYWSVLPCPSPGGLPDPGIISMSLMSPVLAGRFFTTSTTWEVCTFPGFSQAFALMKKKAP